jgi:hypothetical protein
MEEPRQSPLLPLIAFETPQVVVQVVTLRAPTRNAARLFAACERDGACQRGTEEVEGES